MEIQYEQRAQWAKSFYRFDDEKRVALWLLDYTDDHKVCLYMTKDIIHSGVGGNEDFFGRNPVYHVWNGNDWVHTGQSMEAAYRVYNEIINKRTENET